MLVLGRHSADGSFAKAVALATVAVISVFYVVFFPVTFVLTLLSVMLISVRERMREVGLRRALGARKRDVQLQFVMEAGLIAVAGGAGGAVVGALLAGLGGLLGPWDLRISWGVAAGALAASALVGVAAGTVPAWRASRAEPVEALRGTARR